MAARDVFHGAVRKGLEKEDWIVTDDPLRIKAGGVELQIDLGAERIIAAEKEGEKIAVEIKVLSVHQTFMNSIPLLVNFFNYRVALEEQQPDRALYLAVPLGSYQTFFKLQFVQTVIQRLQIKLIIYDPANEVLLEWEK